MTTKYDTKLDEFKKSLIKDLRFIIWSEDTDLITFSEHSIRSYGASNIQEVLCEGCAWEHDEKVTIFKVDENSGERIDVSTLPVETIVEIINAVLKKINKQ